MPSTRFIRPQYTISFYIGSVDLTMRLNTVTIVNSIKSIYPVFFIKLNISSKDYFLEQIYGQNDAKLEIIVTTESSIPLETTHLDLIIIHNNNKVSSQISSGSSESNQLEDEMTIVALYKNAYLTMSQTVNMIVNKKDPRTSGNGFISLMDLNNSANKPINFLEDIFSNVFGEKSTWGTNSKPLKVSSNFVAGNDPMDEILRDFSNYGLDDFVEFIENQRNNPVIVKPILDIINGLGGNVSDFVDEVGEYNPISVVDRLFDRFSKDVTRVIKRSNLNKLKLDDIIIPPVSMINAIRYLNDRYSLYKGPLHVYYSMEDVFNMWDISSIVKDGSVDYTVELLARGGNDLETMKNSSSNDNYFYTYNDIKVQNKTNNAIMNKGYEHIIVKSPRNKFFQTVKTNLKDILDDFSITGKPDIICNNISKEQTRVHSIGVMGNSEDGENAFMSSKLSQYMVSASMFRFYLKGAKIPIRKLTRVGGVMNFIPRINEYLKFSGKYIVGSSVVTLTREKTGSYVCFVEGTCFRESLEN